MSYFLPDPLVQWCGLVTDHLLASPDFPEDQKPALVEHLNGVLARGGIRPRPPFRTQIVPRQPPPEPPA